jgi:hypothetical protein
VRTALELGATEAAGACHEPGSGTGAGLGVSGLPSVGAAGVGQDAVTLAAGSVDVKG